MPRRAPCIQYCVSHTQKLLIPAAKSDKPLINHNTENTAWSWATVGLCITLSLPVRFHGVYLLLVQRWHPLAIQAPCLAPFPVKTQKVARKRNSRGGWAFKTISYYRKIRNHSILMWWLSWHRATDYSHLGQTAGTSRGGKSIF